MEWRIYALPGGIFPQGLSFCVFCGVALELERACYNEMERESMEYFYAAEKELQRQRERIRQLENILTENGIPVPEES